MLEYIILLQHINSFTFGIKACFKEQQQNEEKGRVYQGLDHCYYSFIFFFLKVSILIIHRSVYSINYPKLNYKFMNNDNCL